MQRLLLTSSILMTGLATAAFGQSQDAGNSSFCKAEFTPASQSSDSENRAGWEFKQMDANGDGVVNEAEYVACRNAGSGMESAESDRSGQNMADADTDASGSVSRNEYMTAAESARDQASQAQDQGSEPVLLFRRFIFVPVSASDSDVRGMSQGEASRRAEQQFSALDSDNNDELSKDEWSQRSAKISDQSKQLSESFGKIDSNGDGSLSQEEYSQAIKQQSGGSSQQSTETQG